MGPHSETLGLVAPGDWVDFFRYVGETYSGILVPEHDNRNLKAELIPKLMAAKDQFDVHFERDYVPPELGEWLDSENVLPAPGQPYFLKANTGPKWLLGGVLSRPFIRASQCQEKFAISSIESSKLYDKSPLSRWFRFSKIDHCFCVQEGCLRVKLKSNDHVWTEVREGQTLVISAGEAFTLDWGSRFVRVWTFTNGSGIQEILQRAGEPYSGYVIPETASTWDEDKMQHVALQLDVQIEPL